MSSETRELALDLFQARAGDICKKPRQDTHAGKSESAQWPVSRLRCRERDPKRHFPVAFGLEWSRAVLTPTLPRAHPSSRPRPASSLDTVTHSHAQPSTHADERAAAGARALSGPRAHSVVSPPGTPRACPREPEQPAAPLTWRGRPRAPASRANLAGGPGASARHRMATSAIRPCPRASAGHRRLRVLRGQGTGSRASRAASAKAPAVRSQTQGTKARREWRAPRGRPPSDTN